MEGFFSERYGFQKKDVEALLKTNSKGMTEELRTRLWNIYYDIVTSYLRSCKQEGNDLIEEYAPSWKEGLFYESFIRPLIGDYFGIPLHKLGGKSETFINTILSEIFFNSQWFQVYDLLELLAGTLKNNNLHLFEEFQKQINNALKEKFAPYRMLDGKITPLKDELEVESVISALEKTRDKFHSVYEHLSKALSLFSDRKSPDYSNTIKESISAVDSLLKIVCNNKKTLAQNIKKVCEKLNLHPAFCQAIEKLYGWSSDDKGIRHGKSPGESDPLQAEAKFVLIAATAFINYLLDVMSELGIDRIERG